MTVAGCALAGPFVVICTSVLWTVTAVHEMQTLSLHDALPVSAVSVAVLSRTVPSLVAGLIVTVIATWTWGPAGLMPVEQLIVCLMRRHLAGAPALTKEAFLDVSPAGRVSVTWTLLDASGPMLL